MNMRSGKTVELIRSAVENNGTILVSSDAIAEDIKAKAMRLGLKPPNVIVVARGQGKGVTVAGAIVDNPDSFFQPAITLRCEYEQTPAISYQRVEEAIRKMGDLRRYPQRRHFFASVVPSTIPDQDIIEWFNGSGVIVVDRNGNGWLNGEPHEREI